MVVLRAYGRLISAIEDAWLKPGANHIIRAAAFLARRGFRPTDQGCSKPSLPTSYLLLTGDRLLTTVDFLPSDFVSP